MIIGGNKALVIKNIQKAVRNENYNCKVEVDDPNLTQDQKSAIINHYLDNDHTLGYKVCNLIARFIINAVTIWQNRRTEIEGLENIAGIKKGAIITSNHFNPLDNTVVREMLLRTGRRRLFIVSQESNLAMKGLVGFLMNHADIIPIMHEKEYMNTYFPVVLKKKFENNGLVLIYPEQEMWFNYRKPRPPKRGAYYYAAENLVPIISCFVEIRDVPQKDNEEFCKTEYIMHVLKPIYPDSSKDIRENSLMMMETDYRQKVEAYESAYGKKLSYEFEKDDIAGWISKDNLLT